MLTIRMKIYKKTKITELDLNRDCYTKHGLHLNSVGKKQIILKLVNVIENLPVRDNGTAIKLQWKENEISIDNRVTNQSPGKEGREASMEDQVPNSDNKEPTNDHQLQTSNRTKKIPRTMTSDFLW
jgi:hypothetical protein